MKSMEIDTHDQTLQEGEGYNALIVLPFATMIMTLEQRNRLEHQK